MCITEGTPKFVILLLFVLEFGLSADINSSCNQIDNLDNISNDDRVVIRSQYDGATNYSINQRCSNRIYVKCTAVISLIELIGIVHP